MYGMGNPTISRIVLVHVNPILSRYALFVVYCFNIIMIIMIIIMMMMMIIIITKLYMISIVNRQVVCHHR